MTSNKILFSAITLLLSSLDVTASCTAEQLAPEGKPDNFDINEHLSKFDQAGQAASRLPLGGLVARASIMASMFAPGRKYDLKANPNYMSSQEFGNWFYGAAAAQMGFNEQEALTAGAVVQQWQNYNNTNHADAGDIGKLASNIVHAIQTGEGDNLDDAAPISGGHSYSENVYENDPNSDTNSDSCENDSSSGSSGSGESSYGGGWSGGSTFLFTGGGCYGSCGGGGGGTPVTTITDLPSGEEDGK